MAALHGINRTRSSFPALLPNEKSNMISTMLLTEAFSQKEGLTESVAFVSHVDTSVSTISPLCGGVIYAAAWSQLIA